MPRIIKHQTQLALDLSHPIDHHELLHAQANGTVLYWVDEKWKKVKPGAPVLGIVADFIGQDDTYLTVSQFNGWRKIRLLKSLRACYVDIDHNTDLDAVLSALKAAKMPMPSFVVFSGRGIHCYWRLAPTPANELPLWQNVEDTLVDALACVGADKKARDCTRVLRLTGTVNAKNGQTVRGMMLSTTVWTLKELADKVRVEKVPAEDVPAGPKAKVHDLAAAGARKQRPATMLGTRPGRKPGTRSIYEWWYKVYQDLIVIVEHHWHQGVSEGHRDQLLFLMSVSLSWFTPVDSLQNEIGSTARKFMPTLTSREVETQMATIIKRAQDAQDGKTFTWRGEKVNPRYYFSAEKMRELLGDLIVPELHDRLRCLAPADVIKERKRTRDAARYSDQNTGQGYRVGNKEKRTAARLMHVQGHSIREIAARIGVSGSTVHTWLK